MDAGLVGLLGGVIGAAVGAAGAVTSAVITGRRGERLARMQIEAQMSQAQLQVRATYTQQQVAKRIDAHAKLLDQLETMLSRLDLNPQMTNAQVQREVAEQVTAGLFSDFEAVKSLSTTALIVGPDQAGQKSLAAVGRAAHAFGLWMFFYADVLEGAPNQEPWDNMRTAVVEARNAWRDYASAVREDLMDDGTARPQ
ncbi:hypothetical protein ACI3K4_27745 [Streptomyces sp. CSMPJR101]|uniref:hypothetical protein n=1 Tax=Streptomyces sp. CSMPJR101 TaxID=1279378 RepID=UPI0038539A3A